MGRACNIHGRYKKCTQLWSEILKGKDQLVEPDAFWRIILKEILKDIGCMGVEWINFTQDKAQWQVLVNMVTNLWVS
jgi:hypothetical protein